jgi:spermidine synthase
MKRAYRKISGAFEIAMPYQAFIPTYPSGHWMFGFASRKYHPLKSPDFDAWNALGLKTKYYNTELHKGAFALPNYVTALLNEKETGAENHD